MAVSLISISFFNVVFLFLTQMCVVEILVPIPDEIKGNIRKSQANIQAQTAYSPLFPKCVLVALIWIELALSLLKIDAPLSPEEKGCMY